jgi:hypothetical protein
MNVKLLVISYPKAILKVFNGYLETKINMEEYFSGRFLLIRKSQAMD